MKNIQIQRIYESAQKTDGIRILVDRLWPRGVSKEKATLDYWLKDIAPSPELRVWWDHDPEKMKEFAKRYVQELNNDLEKQNCVKQVLDLAKKQETITLLYAAHDPKVNHALILQNFLLEKEKN